ncbi:hypothetical protein EYF80_045001 [Liparis tanakae]|uniref:Uncharacterized protein n=1 Tax=Liparis tanakae TaxID=230148 RepID=A0A4Z2FUB9_9TELE|nr:hypothetical protein EYF80_045001 [Liparis tanakae]
MSLKSSRWEEDCKGVAGIEKWAGSKHLSDVNSFHSAALRNTPRSLCTRWAASQKNGTLRSWADIQCREAVSRGNRASAQWRGTMASSHSQKHAQRERSLARKDGRTSRTVRLLPPRSPRECFHPAPVGVDATL